MSIFGAGVNMQEFNSTHINKGEFEQLVSDIVQAEHPKESVENIIYKEDGVEVKLDNGEIIDIEVDWEEFKIISTRIRIVK